MALADPSGAPITRMGAQIANSFIDVDAVRDVMADQETKGASLYGYASSEANYNVEAHEPCVSSRVRNSEDDWRMLVWSALNGAASTASEVYRDDDPEVAREMVRQAAKASHRFAGIAVAGRRFAEAGAGCAISVAGLETVPVGNGHYGAFTEADTNISPGQACVWEFPAAGPDGLMAPDGGRLTAEVYRSKFVLQLRPRSAMCVGDALLFHYREILKSSTKWRMAMNDQLYATRTWMAAARAFHQFVQFAGAITLGEAARVGLIMPTSAALGVYAGTGNEENTDLSDRLSALRAGIQEAPDAVAPTAADINSGADALAAAYAEHVSATAIDTGIRARATALATADAAASRALLALPYRVGAMVAFDGRNKAYEVGFDAQGGAGLPVYRGRYNTNGSSPAVNPSTPEGALLQEQLDAARKLFAGAMDAQQEDDRWTAGVALTAGDGVNASHVVLAQGVRR